MSLIVLLSKVKDKAAIAVSTYDSKINSLIAEWVPALEFAIRDEFLSDTGNTGLQATLNLGATEMVAGEMLAQIGREPGASESFAFGWVEVQPNIDDLSDPFGLKQQGEARLLPFLKRPDALSGTQGVLAGGSRTGEDL